LQTQDLVPILLEAVEVDCTSDHRAEAAVISPVTRDIKAAIGKIPSPWGKPEAEKMANDR
jgi:hypothetical protein